MRDFISRYGLPSTNNKSALILSVGFCWRIYDGMVTQVTCPECWGWFRVVLPYRIGKNWSTDSRYLIDVVNSGCEIIYLIGDKVSLIVLVGWSSYPYLKQTCIICSFSFTSTKVLFICNGCGDKWVPVTELLYLSIFHCQWSHIEVF